MSNEEPSLVKRRLKPKSEALAARGLGPALDLTQLRTQSLTALPRGDDQAESLELRTPSCTFTDLLLAPATREALDQVIREHAHAAALVAAGCTPSLRLLFTGPPGTGKTSAANALAAALQMPLLVSRQHELINQYMGSSEKAVARVFDHARESMAVYLIDEFDGLATERSATEGAAARQLNAIVTSILQMMDRHTGPGVIVAATNRVDAIDPAARRRFDVEVEFPLPDAAQRATLICKHLGDDSDVALDVATRERGSHADVVRACVAEKKRRVLLSLENT